MTCLAEYVQVEWMLPQNVLDGATMWVTNTTDTTDINTLNKFYFKIVFDRARMWITKQNLLKSYRA